MKYKLISAEELIYRSECLERCIKTLDQALGYIVCLKDDEGTPGQILREGIYDLLMHPTVDGYIKDAETKVVQISKYKKE